MSSSSLKLVANPLIGHKLARLCDSNTSTNDYPRLLKEITLILGCDATTQEVGECGVGIVPLLKVDSILTSVMLEWLPDASILDIEESNFPSIQTAYILEPCIVASHILHATICKLKDRGVKHIVVISIAGTRAEIDRLLKLHRHHLNIFIGAVDEKQSLIVPCICEVMQRLYGVDLLKRSIPSEAASQASAASAPAPAVPAPTAPSAPKKAKVKPVSPVQSKPLTNETIRSAVALWMLNPQECVLQYGHISEWDTSQVTDMKYLFAGQTSFNEDISKWNVSQVKTMKGMFDGASTFNQPLLEWQVNQVTDMSYMFRNAIAFNQTLYKWDVSQVIDMTEMFCGAQAFNRSLNSWKIANVLHMSKFLHGAHCFNQSLKKWDDAMISNKSPKVAYWADLKQGMTSALMLQCCCYRMDISHTLIGLISDYLPTPLDNNTIREAVQLWISDQDACIATYGHISDWDTSQVTNMKQLFRNLDEFNDDISRWNVSRVITMSEMFLNATSFNQPLQAWNVISVIDMSRMFLNAAAFNQPLQDWNVRNVVNISGMFYAACLFNQPLKNWSVMNVRDMSYLFKTASSFNQPLHTWCMKNVRTISDMFFGASSFNQPLEDWDLHNVTVMSSIFYGALTFNQPLNKWNVSKCTDMRWMFCEASSFNQPLDQWDVSQVVDMRNMFDGASAFNQPLDSWDIDNVLNMRWMFSEATSFNQRLDSCWNLEHVLDKREMFVGTAIADEAMQEGDEDSNVDDLTAYPKQVLASFPLIFSNSDHQPKDPADSTDMNVDMSIDNGESILGKMKPNICCTVLGDISVGKSTLIGHLYQKSSGGTASYGLNRNEQEVKAKGRPKSDKFAWLLDQSKDARDAGMSTNIIHQKFETKNSVNSKHTLSLTVTPGDPSYFKHMISSLSQADAVLFVVDVTPNEFEASWSSSDGQSKEQLLLAYTIGDIRKKQLIIALNKMDACEYSEQRFEDVKAMISYYLDQLGFDAEKVPFIPVSGAEGDNLMERSAQNMPWYTGPSLAESFDLLEAVPFSVRLHKAQQPFRLAVQDVHKIGGIGTVVVGRIETGVWKPGMNIQVSPSGLTTTMKSIEMHHAHYSQGNPGFFVGMNVVNPQVWYGRLKIDRGEVITDNNSTLRACDKFQAMIVMVSQYPKQIRPGYTPMLHCHTTCAPAHFESLDAKIDVATGEVLEKNPKSMQTGDVCLVTIKPLEWLILEKYEEYPRFGRFCIRDKRRIVAVGIIKSIVYEEPEEKSDEKMEE